MVFVEGLAGQVFSDLGLTVVTSLIASLIVAVWFIPMLASRTGFKIKSGAGMAFHPLGGMAGRIALSTFVLRILLPMLLLLGVMVGVACGYATWVQSMGENPNPAKQVAFSVLTWKVARFWGLICFVPIVVSLAKTRWKPADAKGGRMREIWMACRAFIESFNGVGKLRWLLLPYFLVRLPFSFLLELIGLSLVWLIRGCAGLLLVPAKLMVRLRGLFPRRAQAPKADIEKGIYPRILRWALAHPSSMVALSGACFVLTYTVGKQLQTELLPEVHQSEFTFEAALPVGTPLDETVSVLSRLERALLARKDDLQIETLLVMYGFDTSNMKRSDEGEHSARFKFLLKPTEHPQETEEQVIRDIRRMFQNVPDIDTRVTRPVLFSSKKPVVIQINGEDLAELKQFSDEATSLLSKSVELADVEPTLRSGAPEVQISYDRQQIIRHGLNIRYVANQMRDLVKGSEATRLNRRDRRVPIVVRLAESDREQVMDVGKLTVNPGGATPIPLNSIADLTVGEGPSEIRRIDGKRVALVQANIGGGSLGAAVGAAQRMLTEGIAWPVYMDFLITGQNQEWERSRGSLFLALGLSLFLVYVIMASQFESFVQPLIIMFTIPMAFVGTVIGLQLLGINLSVVVFLGMIMLAGIVVNNAIVLVDYTNTLRGRGLELREAIVQAGRVRLRPILMTTATTVLGLLPMALGMGDGAEIRTPMAIAVICGLLTSTFLTLLIIPTLYYLFALAGERFVQRATETT